MASWYCGRGGLTQAQQLRLDDRAQAPVRDDDTAVEIEVDGIRVVDTPVLAVTRRHQLVRVGVRAADRGDGPD